MLVGGSPFAASLTKYPTTRAEVVFPTASPDQPAWVAEAATIPTIGLNDDADIVAVKKLAEILQDVQRVDLGRDREPDRAGR